MSKANVTRLFVGAILATACGLIVSTATIVAGILDGVVTFGGPTLVSVDGGALAGMLGLMVVASVLGSLGALAALAAWVGALVNTSRLEDKTWVVALLVLGLCSFGWFALAAYVIAGPDGTTPRSAGQVTGILAET